MYLERIRAMSKIFHEYGGTIITVIAVVLMISFVTTSMNTGGVLYNAFGDMINSFSEKSNDMVNGAAGGSGEGEEAGWPISWNTMDVMDNPKVDMGDGTYLVKVSDYTPTAAELADTKMTVTMDGVSTSMVCLMAEKFADGLDAAVYDENEEYILFSVATADEIDGLQFPETGLWTIDYGSLGMDADVKVEVVPVLTEIAGLVDGVVLFDSDTNIYYATNEATLTRFGLDTTNITYSTSGLPEEYVAGDGDIVMHGDYEYRYNCAYIDGWMSDSSVESALGVSIPAGWGARVLDSTKTTYGRVLDNLFGQPVNVIGTFRGCSNLVNIPNVSNIGLFAFSGCTSLTSISIPDGVTNVGVYAFQHCNNLEEINIPDTVTVIDSNAFDNCDSITNIIIPDSVNILGAGAFYQCDNLMSVSMGSGVTQIGDVAFYQCYNLTNVTLGSSLKSIGDRAFSNCKNLTSITIPNSVTSIGDSAFYSCTSLPSITIPSSVTSIGERAFQHCLSLTSATIPDSVTTIGGYAFYNCTSLTSVTVPNSVTSIGDSAFEDCTSLTSIIIPDNVTSIGDDAFCDCSSLTSIDIPDSVTSLGAGAFGGCTSLTNVTIGNSVTSIGASTFSGCTSLTSITIPDGVTTIGANVFYSCTNLTSITIPGSVTSIGARAFSGCTSLTSITIPDSVTSIDGFAFEGCTNLTSVTFENPNGWWYAASFNATSGTDLPAADLADVATAATYLKSTYVGYYWSRSEG